MDEIVPELFTTGNVELVTYTPIRPPMFPALLKEVLVVFPENAIAANILPVTLPVLVIVTSHTVLLATIKS